MLIWNITSKGLRKRIDYGFPFDMKEYQFDIKNISLTWNHISLILKKTILVLKSIVLSQIRYLGISIWYEKYPMDMFDNINMTWQHKGPKFICKITDWSQIWYQFGITNTLFKNINMIWQHKGPKLICKDSRLMTSFGI